MYDGFTYDKFKYFGDKSFVAVSLTICWTIELQEMSPFLF
jgi:hypothetical protein